MARLRAHFPLLILLAATLWALGNFGLGASFRVDDAYIVARYAENLVQHGQLTWNLGEPPVEGFTGYFLLGIMTIATALHLDPLVVAGIVGIFSWFVGARILFACHEPLGYSPVAGAIAAALFLCAAEQPTHAMSSLETELFLLLTLACAYVAMQRAARESGSGSLWPLPTLALLIALTRPEGLVIGGAFLGGVLLREHNAWRRWLPSVLGIFALPYGAIQVIRRLYFGSFLPNTYYAKALAPGESSVFFETFSKHARDYLAAPIIIALTLFALSRFSGTTVSAATKSTRYARWSLLASLLPSFLALGASYQRSDLVMNYSDRFAFHLFGLSCLLVLVAIGEAIWHFERLELARSFRSAVFVLMGVGLFLPFTKALENIPKEFEFRRKYSFGVRTHYIPAANWLERELPPNATLAVYPDAGIVPYATHLRTIDFGKLNDAYLARPGRSSRATIDYFFEKHPDALMISLKSGFAQTYDKTGDLLLADPRFSTYRLAMLDLHNDVGLAIFVPR